MFRGPDEAVVTSGYIGAGRSGSPIPIEYLPAENTLSSRIRLLILYQGRPTTTIAVGDPLTFRLEAQDGYSYPADIFATNVIARDPYSGRSVQLIDRYGCPVDNYVFPGLDRLREGDSLEARFNAFKIPESNFLVFEATVRTCRDGCQPAFCSSAAGRSEPSYGRKKRSIEGEDGGGNSTDFSSTTELYEGEGSGNGTDTEDKKDDEEQEFVQEMIEVLDSRFDIENSIDDVAEVDTVAEKHISPVVNTVCITPNEYYGLIVAVVVLVSLLISIVLLTIIIYRKYVHCVIVKNKKVDRLSNHSRNSEDLYSTRSNNFSFLRTGLRPSPSGSSPLRSLGQMMGQRTLSTTILAGASGSRRSIVDPSEPIYTDPSLFEVPVKKTTRGHNGNSSAKEDSRSENPNTM
uniref:ZP domain-containing protein n=1 Tax=Trichogramma kaykai TaxID=54128 RepID=A0ABD2X1N8_9HYME